MHSGSFEQNAYALEGQRLTADSGISVPAILAGLFGVGLLVAHADADEVCVCDV